MNTELDAVKKRIRALSMKTLANGCTEGEAIAAMEKVGELLEIYNLTMDQVHVSAEPCIQRSIDLKRRTQPHWSFIFTTIAQFTQVKVWMTKPFIHFFGLEPDVILAVYLSQIVLHALESETRNFHNTPTYRKSLRRRTMTKSFRHGLVRRLSERLDELRPKGKGLVLTKQAHIETEFAKANPDLRLRRVQSKRTRVIIDGFEAGAQAGANINLNRPLSQDRGQSVAGYLT